MSVVAVLLGVQPLHAQICFAGCSHATCYPASCVDNLNTVADSTAATLLQVTASQTSFATTSVSLSFTFRYSSNGGASYQYLTSSQLVDFSSGCAVQLQVTGDGGSTICATATGTVYTAALSFSTAGTYTIYVNWRLGLNPLNLCVAEGHATLGTYAHIHAQGSSSNPCEIYVTPANTLSVTVGGQPPSPSPPPLPAYPPQ
eukprot:7378649-Prymnesium_polylepis.1